MQLENTKQRIKTEREGIKASNQLNYEIFR